MLHPLVKLLATRPDLLADHADAYIDLAAAEAGGALDGLKKRALLAWAAMVLAALGLMLVGLALMLVAAMPLNRMPAPWVLALLPAVVWTAAGGCAWGARRQPAARPFQILRDQIRQDAQLLREAHG